MRDNCVSIAGVMHGVKRIHFVGIGGCGMSGIAKILHLQGYVVSGSDQCASDRTRLLSTQGMTVYLGHNKAHCHDKDLVVISSAIDQTNPEVVFAIKAGIPVIKRGLMLAYLMQSHQGIAIAGTHGKTTTTSMIVHLLKIANLNPSYVIGGKLKNCVDGADLGTGRYFIAEADESDASFLHLHPQIACLTNIDIDHIENYQSDFSQLTAAFLSFLRNLPEDGLVVYNFDDPKLRALCKTLHCQSLSFGFHPDADVSIKAVNNAGSTSRFLVQMGTQTEPFSVTLPLPGKHNVQNALCAVALASFLGIAQSGIQTALASFPGTQRRFDSSLMRLYNKEITLIDDYGHHPRAIDATLSAIRVSYPKQRIVLIFEPHRYTRTRALFSAFVEVLSTVDKLLLLPIYGASEAPIEGITSQALANDMTGVDIEMFNDFTAVKQALMTSLKAGDVLVIQGAGSIGQLKQELLG